jgi:CheY-like chemotaxis protein
MLRFQSDERRETRLLSINGLPVEALSAVEHWGVPDTLVLLELEMPAGSAIGLEIVEHMLRPEELLGAEAFERPADLAPDESWMSDRAMIKTSFIPGAVEDSTTAITDSLSTPIASPPAPLDTMPVAPDTSLTTPDTSGVQPDTIQP